MEMIVPDLINPEFIPKFQSSSIGLSNILKMQLVRQETAKPAKLGILINFYQKLKVKCTPKSGDRLIMLRNSWGPIEFLSRLSASCKT